jgi:hypothetical protein
MGGGNLRFRRRNQDIYSALFVESFFPSVSAFPLI